MAEIVGVPALFTGLVDLASADLGGQALLTSDDFFAEKENLLLRQPAHFDPTTYTDRGKLMDGWESRRKRVPGHDWCIIRLGVPGEIRAVDIDTSHFLGNHAPYAALDGCFAPGAPAEALSDSTPWVPLVPETPMKRGSSNVCAVVVPGVYSHVRLHMIPDGGIARLRVYGVPQTQHEAEEVDLAAVEQGGVPLVASDSFFSPMTNLVLPGESTIMSNGWETRRSRPPGMDYIIVRLGQPGRVNRITLQTHHFKGNFPDRAAVDGLYWPNAPASMLVANPDWQNIVGETPLRANDSRDFPTVQPGPYTHLRLRIFPDGGISRMRAWGRPTADNHAKAGSKAGGINAMDPASAVAFFERCCGAPRWVADMLAARPFTSNTHLLGEAERVWWRLVDADWKQAFAHHPRIGANLDTLRERFASTASWSSSEQAGMSAASDATIAALHQGNIEYATRFGYGFIVCATGLSAEEMLQALQGRLGNSPENEIRVAAGELLKIAKIRLLK